MPASMRLSAARTSRSILQLRSRANCQIALLAVLNAIMLIGTCLNRQNSLAASSVLFQFGLSVLQGISESF